MSNSRSPNFTNIPKASIDPLSYSAVPIKLTNIETGAVISSATGFFYKSGKIYYLVTNWHNLTGINPNTKTRIGEFAASPTGVQIPFLKQKAPYIEWERRVCSLYTAKNVPKWYIHSKYKELVDVAVLELGANDANLPIVGINEIDFDSEPPRVADEVFILGFPHNLSSGGNFPLWKRGSIASEPDINLDNLPKLLVDSASRPGMSGSPVIYRRQGIHGLIDGVMTGTSIIGEIQNFCGIYSGRIRTNTELDTQLGIIWKTEVIMEIINAKFKEKIFYPHHMVSKI